MGVNGGAGIIPSNRLLGDNVSICWGAGSPACMRWDTSDANANHLMLQLPAGGAVDVPVLLVGQGIFGNDLGIYDGELDPVVGLLGVGGRDTAARFDLRKTRGTATAPTVITTGDDLGSIRAFGFSGAGGYVEAARIELDTEGTVATTRVPGIIRFLTGTDAAPTVLTTAMTINSAQAVGIGATPVDGTRLTLPQENDEVTPTLAFGNGDTGFYRPSDTQISIAIQGVTEARITTAGIGVAIAGGGFIFNETAGATNPTLVPAATDPDTGIGAAGTDQLCLIVGGVEGVRISEVLGEISIIVGGGVITVDFALDVAFPARTATVNQDYSHMRVTNAGAVTIPTGTTSDVSTLRVAEPNIIATGTVTRASTLLVDGIPTEGTTNIGLIIDGGPSDAQHFAIVNSDVATGLSTLPTGPTVATDCFYQITKASSANGGAFAQSFGSTSQAQSFFHESWAGAPQTTDTSASLGAINFFAGEHNGANAALNMGADSNLFAIGETDSTSVRRTRFLLKADDGELHLGNTTLVALDAQDDRQLVRAMQRESAGSGIINSKWDNPFYSYSKLQEFGLVGEKDDEDFFLFPLQTRLHAHEGAIWQNYLELRGHEVHFTALEERIGTVEMENQILEDNMVILKSQVLALNGAPGAQSA